MAKNIILLIGDFMAILHFRSNVNYNLYLNGEYVDYILADRSADVVATKSVNYMYCPLSDNTTYISYSGIIRVEGNKAYSLSNDVKVVPYGNGHYDIYFMAKSIDILSKFNLVLEQSIQNKDIKIYNNGSGYIEISGEKICMSDVVRIADIEEYSGHIVIECVLENDRYIVIYDINGGEVECSTHCDKVERNGVEYKILIDQKDMLAQGVVISYNLATKAQDSYVVYIRKCKKVVSSYAVPYAFFAAIRAKNYTLAKSYLSSNFADIQPMQMENYFGKISQVYYNPYELSGRISYIIEGDGYRSYNFDIKDGLIEDISEAGIPN